MFHDKSYLFYFALAGIVSQDDVPHMCSLPDIERPMCLLKNISVPLENDEKQNFYKMLEILQAHGNLQAQQLAEDIQASVRREDPVVRSKTTRTITSSIKGITSYVKNGQHTCS